MIARRSAAYEFRFVPEGALSEESMRKEIRGGGNFSQTSEYKNGLPRPSLEYIHVYQPDKYTPSKGSVNGLTGHLLRR